MKTPPEWLQKLTQEDDRQDHKTVEMLYPELRGSVVPSHLMQRHTATLILNRFRRDIYEKLLPMIKDAADASKNREDIVKLLVADHENLKIQLQQSQSDLHACQELRGINESKKVTELLNDVASKERALAQASELQTELANSLDEVRNELEGRKAAAAGAERDASDLATAAAMTAVALATVRTKLTNAKDNITDRYGNNVPAFTNAILEDIVAALAALPGGAQKINGHAQAKVDGAVR